MKLQTSETIRSLWCLSDAVQARITWNNFFFAVSLQKNTTGEEIFKKIDSFFKEHQLSESDCVFVCANSAPSTIKTKKDFMSFVKKEKQHNLVIRCLLHRENLEAKEIQEDLAIVFKEVVSAVNYIKSHPSYSRLFRTLCDEMGADHSGLLFYLNIRWLSRGKVLERVASLRNEIGAFLNKTINLPIDSAKMSRLSNCSSYLISSVF